MKINRRCPSRGTTRILRIIFLTIVMMVCITLLEITQTNIVIKEISQTESKMQPPYILANTNTYIGMRFYNTYGEQLIGQNNIYPNR
jgi:hypothetical protein